MSIKQYPGGIITKNPTAPTTSSAKGIWTVDQASNYVKQGIWPRIPGAPTIGTATVSGTTASVPFTAPTDLGAGSITYTATSSPGGLTGTGTSPISVSGLTGGTSYTFTVAGATPGGTGPSSAASNSVTAVVQGQQAYTTAGTFSWVAPAGVTSVSVVAVGYGNKGANSRRIFCSGTYYYIGSAGGGAGGLAYGNNLSVTPGNSYTVVVLTPGSGQPFASKNYFSSASYLYAESGAVAVGGGGGGTAMTARYFGGNGGTSDGTNDPTSDIATGGGGGGAAGYAGNGGAGGTQGSGTSYSAGAAGSGGGGGGGASGRSAGAGGGVGILGQGSSGAGGTTAGSGPGGGGGGGSSGGAGKSSTGNGNGASNTGCFGLYGGGGGGATGVNNGGCSPNPCEKSYTGGSGAIGAVRIIWPGTSRSFPSTNTGNL